MPDDLDTPALRRFARDLRRIREDRSVSLASIQEETQVHASHLESFEKGVLHEESRMNDVYLKAFVRAYAEAIGLSAEPVMNHLGSALSGTYDDELATAFLDVPPPQDESVGADGSVTESLDEEDAEAPGSVGNSSSDSENGPLHDSSSDQSPAAQKERTGGVGTETPSRASGRSSSAETAGDATRFSDRSEGKETEPEGVRSRERGSPSRTAATSGSFQDVVANHRGKVLAIGGVVLFLVLVGGLGSLFMKSGEEGSPPSDAESVEKAPTAEAGPSPSEASADSPAPAPEPSRRAPADIALGDTLYVTVRATADVRELRVQQDDNLRRPYWIEEGEARVFPFTERVTLQNRLDSLQLLLEGYRYPITSTDAEGRVIIRRDTAEQFADTLRGAPVSITATPDTIEGSGSTLDLDTTSSGPSDPES